MTAFWGLGLLYAVLDLVRPAWANPYKIQEGMKVSKTDFLKAVAMALLNQLILFGVVLLGWKIFPTFCPDGFSVELPSLLTAVLQMLVSLVFAELVGGACFATRVLGVHILPCQALCVYAAY